MTPIPDNNWGTAVAARNLFIDNPGILRNRTNSRVFASLQVNATSVSYIRNKYILSVDRNASSATVNRLGLHTGDALGIQNNLYHESRRLDSDGSNQQCLMTAGTDWTHTARTVVIARQNWAAGSRTSRVYKGPLTTFDASLTGLSAGNTSDTNSVYVVFGGDYVTAPVNIMPGWFHACIICTDNSTDAHEADIAAALFTDLHMAY